MMVEKCIPKTHLLIGVKFDGIGTVPYGTGAITIERK